MKYTEKADLFLEEFYKQFNAVTPEQKFEVLEQANERLGHSRSCFSRNPTIEQKVAMLEYEILELAGVMDIVYV